MALRDPGCRGRVEVPLGGVVRLALSQGCRCECSASAAGAGWVATGPQYQVRTVLSASGVNADGQLPAVGLGVHCPRRFRCEHG